MKLELKLEDFRSKLEVKLDIPLYYQTIKQLRRPHDPNFIIWKNMLIPLNIKLDEQICIPIKQQLYNIHI